MFEKEKPNLNRSAFLPAVVTPVPSPKQTIGYSSSDSDALKQIESSNGAINKTKKSTAVKRRAKWKKPKDKPKRPLSAYNIFFQEQRKIVMQDESTNVHGFSGLAKFVGAKWKTLDAASRSLYEKCAREEKTRYYVALAEWKHKKERKGLSRQSPPLHSLLNNTKSPRYSLPTQPMMRPLMSVPVSPFRNNFGCPSLWMNGLLPSQLYQNLLSESPLEKELREFENSLPPSVASVVDDNSHESFSSSLEDDSVSEKDVLHKNIDDSSNNLELPSKSPLEKELREFESGLAPSVASVVDDNSHESFYSSLEDDTDSENDVLHKNIDDSSTVNLEQHNSKSTAMTRAFQTFDHLGVDEEFSEFVSSMEW